MPENAKIAIVILNWNGEKLFKTFLPSIIRNSQIPGTKIYVADNGSTDNSVNFLNKNFPEVITIRLNKNYGFAEGYNQALKRIDADYFILINSDVEVTPNWMLPCIKMLKKDTKLAAVQPKILSYHKPHQFEHAGAVGGFIDKYGYPFCRGRILNIMEPDIGQYNNILSTFWASGACMFIKAEIFKNAGGFDGSFWAHMEEIDLCWRLKNQGYKFICNPQSVVFHYGGATLPYTSPQKVYLNFRNNLFMLYKNLPKNRFHRIFLVRMILDGIAAAKFLAGFHFTSFYAVVKAHISFYRNLNQLTKKRKKLLPLIIVEEHAEIYPKSIMWKFFIQKIKKFSQLNFNSKNE